MNITQAESPFDAILQEDLEKIAESFPFAGELSGKTVLVTGATGLSVLRLCGHCPA